jgi:hypothetical protein
MYYKTIQIFSGYPFGAKALQEGYANLVEVLDNVAHKSKDGFEIRSVLFSQRIRHGAIMTLRHPALITVNHST